MENDADDNKRPEWLADLPVRTEEIGYSADELITCERCGRHNAPDRSACLYCGAAISNSVPARLEITELENWENGYNVVAAAADSSDSERFAGDLASALRLDGELIERGLRSRKPFPVARVATPEQAASISDFLSALSIQSLTIRDADLLRAGPPLRLRSVEFNIESIRLTPFAGGDAVILNRDDLALVVSSVLLSERQESTEQKKRRSTTTINESNISSDQPIIDIYSRTDPTGWRIPVSGFDFSSLGDEKSLLAHENMRRLAKRFMEVAPAARFVDDYLSVRSMLEVCWPSEHRKDAKIPRLVTFGAKKTTNVFTTDNTVQVTKYSRLQWHLL